MPSESGLSVGLSRIADAIGITDAMNSRPIQIFTDDRITPAVLDILRKAKKRVILVSPYNKLWGHFNTELDEAVNRGVKVTMLYREGEETESTDWLKKQGVSGYAVKNLHAKIYMNEAQVLVTSMNLYDSSAQNSREICIAIEDEELQKEIRDYVAKLRRTAASAASVKPETDTPKGVREKRSKYTGNGTRRKAVKTDRGKATSVEAYCVRGGDSIDFNAEKPLCDKHYKSWSNFKNQEYKEKYCHGCGEKKSTTYAKPFCRPCWKEHFG